MRIFTGNHKQMYSLLETSKLLLPIYYLGRTLGLKLLYPCIFILTNFSDYLSVVKMHLEQHLRIGF